MCSSEIAKEVFVGKRNDFQDDRMVAVERMRQAASHSQRTGTERDQRALPGPRVDGLAIFVQQEYEISLDH